MTEYIERKKVTEFIKNYGKGAISDGLKTLDPVDDIVSLVRGLNLMPAADVAPVVHGEWIEGKELERCSICGKKGFPDWPYCPKCGAKMDGGKAK